MKPCAHCGAEISGLREHGLCPACLLRLGLEPDLPTPDVVIDGETYRVLGPIGRGPNGTVYLGCGVRKPRRFVTVKVIEQPIDLEVFLPLMHELLDRLPVSGRMHGAGRLIGTIVTNDGRACVCAEYAPGAAARPVFRCTRTIPGTAGSARRHLRTCRGSAPRRPGAWFDQGAKRHRCPLATRACTGVARCGRAADDRSLVAQPARGARSAPACRRLRRGPSAPMSMTCGRWWPACSSTERTSRPSAGTPGRIHIGPRISSAANMATELKSALGQMQGV